MKRILKYFWRNKVDLILLVVTVELLVAHFITGKDFSQFLLIMAGYVCGTIIRVGTLTDKLEALMEDNVERVKMGFDSHKYQTPLFSILDIFFTVVWIGLLVALFFILIK